jgi:pyroglutamyl-peptidase
VLRSDEKILDNGPDAYFTTLPVKEFAAAITAKGIPSSVSLSAGAFLCNHVFYVAQNKFAGTKVRSGFVHVPLMASQAPEFPGMPTMPLEQMVTAVRAMLEVL